MSVLQKLKPEITFAAVVDNMVTIHTTATDTRKIRCYSYGKQPNKNVGDEFIVVRRNGTTRSRVAQLGCFMGDIAVEIYCKLQADNTTKNNRIEEIIGQLEDAANCKIYNGYYFSIAADNVIIPTTTNLTEGYSLTVINVMWRTTDSFNNNN